MGRCNCRESAASFPSFLSTQPYPTCKSTTFTMDVDADMMDLDVPLQQQSRSAHDLRNARKIVVAIDFGTTCSSVAFVSFGSNAQRGSISVQQIETIEKYPGSSPKYIHKEVPSEILYDWRDDDSMSEDESDGNTGSDKSNSIPNVPHSNQQSRLPQTTMGVHRARMNWGFEVPERLRSVSLENDTCSHLVRFKLMLDKSDVTVPVRRTLTMQCQALRDLEIITQDLDVIVVYLTSLLSSVKKELLRINRYQGNETAEYVLCVPAAWKSAALRSMQTAMAMAIERSGLSQSQKDGAHDFFLVSEPEAAATCVLAAEKVTFKVCQPGTIRI